MPLIREIHEPRRHTLPLKSSENLSALTDGHTEI